MLMDRRVSNAELGYVRTTGPCRWSSFRLQERHAEGPSNGFCFALPCFQNCSSLSSIRNRFTVGHWKRVAKHLETAWRPRYLDATSTAALGRVSSRMGCDQTPRSCAPLSSACACACARCVWRCRRRRALRCRRLDTGTALASLYGISVGRKGGG